MVVKRKLDLRLKTKERTCFLFGPRGVGKTTLIRETFTQQCLVIDLLRSREFTDLSADPGILEELCRGHKFVIIDEVQRIPELLNEVHRLIEEKGIRFLLTGSSARKLKQQHANMLGGRASSLKLFPFLFTEIGQGFDLSRALLVGTLPTVWLNQDPIEILDAYLTTYLKEEITAEGLIRNLPAFSRFLKVSALASGELINYAAIASDATVKETTVRSHFQVLEDTLIGSRLEPFVESKKRKAIATEKFFYFDNGVRNFILGIESLDRNSDIYGKCFETFIFNELKAYLSYNRIHKPLTFWRSRSQFEVDFLIGNSIAIEVKATKKVTDKHLKGLRALAEENIFKSYYLVSEDPVTRIVKEGHNEYSLMPWNVFLTNLWNKKIG